jgi:hypothetical protein
MSLGIQKESDWNIGWGTGYPGIISWFFEE